MDGDGESHHTTESCFDRQGAVRRHVRPRRSESQPHLDEIAARGLRAATLIPIDADAIQSGRPSQPAMDRSIQANTSDRLHRRHVAECRRRRCNRSFCRAGSRGSPSRRSRTPRQRPRMWHLSCTAIYLLKTPASSWPPLLRRVKTIPQAPSPACGLIS